MNRIFLYWSDDQKKTGNLSFEEVFDLVDNKIKTELAFYLDLFGN